MLDVTGVFIGVDDELKPALGDTVAARGFELCCLPPLRSPKSNRSLLDVCKPIKAAQEQKECVQTT